MVARVLIVGGYGNFGAHIAARLAAEPDIQVIIGGRSAARACALAASLAASPHPPEGHAMDIREGFGQVLDSLRPDIVIHTSGPFQAQDHAVARQCIATGCHYIDLADARAFVAGIAALDAAARAAGVLAVSGASSVPCLTAAVIDEHIGAFAELTKVESGIATAQRTNRGLATTAAVLSYAGKPFVTLVDGTPRIVHGWQDLHARILPGIGRRLFANCDIPDLDIFPTRYPTLKTLRFYAGLEVPALQLGLWLLTWLVRARLLPHADAFAPALLHGARLFDRAGSDVSGFYMALSGTSASGAPKTVTFDLTAGSGDGPLIPCVPSIVLARRLARDQVRVTGATPCVGLVDLSSYLGELAGMDIRWTVSSQG